MSKKIYPPQKLNDERAQEFLEYLRNDLTEALEKSKFRPKNPNVLKASERLNMFLSLYIEE